MTFPWLTWNNRPFANSMELMLVPATSAEQLMRQHTASFNTSTSPYFFSGAASFQSPFQHLLPFMLTNKEFLTPPAPVLLPPVRLCAGTLALRWDRHDAESDDLLDHAVERAGFMSFFHPPFNKVSNYRDPGLVNINTIPGDQTGNPSPVWLGLLNSPTSATVPVTPTWHNCGQSPRVWQCRSCAAVEQLGGVDLLREPVPHGGRCRVSIA